MRTVVRLCTYLPNSCIGVGLAVRPRASWITPPLAVVENNSVRKPTIEERSVVVNFVKGPVLTYRYHKKEIHVAKAIVAACILK